MNSNDQFPVQYLQHIDVRYTQAEVRYICHSVFYNKQGLFIDASVMTHESQMHWLN